MPGPSVFAARPFPARRLGQPARSLRLLGLAGCGLVCLGLLGACQGEVQDHTPPQFGPAGQPVWSDGSCGLNGTPCEPGQTAGNGGTGCAAPFRICEDTCVDPATSNAHCGGCGQTCEPDEICDFGACRPANSPQCQLACGGGRVCVDGTCICPEHTEICGESCIDTRSDPLHCGGCGRACSAEESCQASQCVCQEGYLACDGACTDTRSDARHCGGCGTACGLNETCMGGACVTPPGPDGCTVAARNLRIREVAAYQAIKIPLATRQGPVAPSQRPADVVQGRRAMFRVFVDTEPGFTARELSARLTLVHGAEETMHFAKLRVSGSSTESALASTFQIDVPGEALRADTRYRVEVVECEPNAGTGSVLEARIPAEGEAMLGARRTGALRIRVVPVAANGRVPNTSAAALDVYRNYFMAMYPVTGVEIEVTSQISTGYPINWTTLLDQVAAKRRTDNPPGDVYYYGLVAPTATMREYCQRGCTAGVGYVGRPTQPASRASVGLAFADEGSAEIMAHELGHNHGRNHAPCAPGTIAGVDAAFPHAGAGVGVWGYDMRTSRLIDPGRSTDIMGYCNNKWVSDYTYRALADRVATFDIMLARLGPEPSSRWRVLLLDESGARWGLPYEAPAPAFGDPEPAQILDSQGQVLAEVTVYSTEIGDADAASVLVPEPEPGWHSVRVTGAAPLTFVK
jgi:hypothetical protein